MRALKVFAVVFFASVGAASGQTITGNQLLDACQSELQAAQGYCIGHIEGVRDGLIAGAASVFIAAGDRNASTSELNAAVNGTFGMCIPSEATTKQMVDVTIQYLQAHAEARHNPARFLILEALKGAFPCS